MTESTENTDSLASPGATLFVVCIVQFAIPFLMSTPNVALPVIGRELDASAVQLGLAQTVYVLAVVSLLLPAGRFADIHGRKRIFITGTVIVCVSTLAPAFVHSIRTFLVLRFVQGLGAAMIFSTSLAILTAVFPEGRRGRAMGISTANVYIGLAIGPSLSGFIVTQMGWRWVFVMIFLLETTALIVTLAKLKGEWISAKGEPFDWGGTLIFMVSIIVLIFGATQLTDTRAAKWITLAGLIGMAIFFRVEWTSAHPLLDLRLIKENLAFTFSNLATFINYAAMASFIFFVSLYLQYVKGLSPQSAGLVLVIQPAIQALLALPAGRLSDTYPPSHIATIGMGLCTLGMFLAISMDPNTSFTFIVMVMVLLGMSLGLFSTPNMTAIMGCVGPRHFGTAASMVSTMRTSGMLFSTTVIAAILSYYMGDQAVTGRTITAFMKSMHASLFMFAILNLAGTFLSIVRRRLSER